MDLLVAAVNAAVVAAVGLILGWLGKGRIDKLGRDFNARMDRVEARIDRLEERFEARLDAIRSDLTRVALAVGVRPEAGSGGR